MKAKFLIPIVVASTLLVVWMYKKVKSIDISRLKFFILSIDTPTIKSGILYIPIKIGVDNQTGLSINASDYNIRFTADINAIDNQGNSSNLMSGAPLDNQQLIINNNQINVINIQLYTSVISLTINTLNLLKAEKLEIVIYPSVLDYQIEPIKYEIPFGIFSSLF